MMINNTVRTISPFESSILAAILDAVRMNEIYGMREDLATEYYCRPQQITLAITREFVDSAGSDKTSS